MVTSFYGYDVTLTQRAAIATADLPGSIKEIERVAKDHRFVQITMLVMGDALLGGRRVHLWRRQVRAD